MQAIPIWDELKETTGQFRRLVLFSLKIKWPLPCCHASQHCHLHIRFLLCPNQSCFLCQTGLHSAKWTWTVQSAVLSPLACTVQVLPRFLSSLMGSHPHPCSAAGLPKCQEVFWCSEERDSVLSPLCCRRKVGGCVGDKHSGDPAGGSRCNWESRKEQKQRWLREALTLLPLLANPLLATHRHQMSASTPHLEIRQMFYGDYIMEWKLFLCSKRLKQSEWVRLIHRFEELDMGR